MPVRDLVIIGRGGEGLDCSIRQVVVRHDIKVTVVSSDCSIGCLNHV